MLLIEALKRLMFLIDDQMRIKLELNPEERPVHILVEKLRAEEEGADGLEEQMAKLKIGTEKDYQPIKLFLGLTWGKFLDSSFDDFRTMLGRPLDAKSLTTKKLLVLARLKHQIEKLLERFEGAFHDRAKQENPNRDELLDDALFTETGRAIVEAQLLVNLATNKSLVVLADRLVFKNAEGVTEPFLKMMIDVLIEFNKFCLSVDKERCQPSTPYALRDRLPAKQEKEDPFAKAYVDAALYALENLIADNQKGLVTQRGMGSYCNLSGPLTYMRDTITSQSHTPELSKRKRGQLKDFLEALSLFQEKYEAAKDDLAQRYEEAKGQLTQEAAREVAQFRGAIDEADREMATITKELEGAQGNQQLKKSKDNAPAPKKVPVQEYLTRLETVKDEKRDFEVVLRDAEKTQQDKFDAAKAGYEKQALALQSRFYGKVLKLTDTFKAQAEKISGTYIFEQRLVAFYHEFHTSLLENAPSLKQQKHKRKYH